MKKDIYENIDKAEYYHVEAFKDIFHVWQQEILFTWRWWLGVALGIFPWLWWWFLYRKKDSTGRLLYAGYFVIAISVSLDVIGDQIGLWSYRFETLPLIPAFVPWDFTLMPVVIMFLIQTKPQIRPIYKAIFFSLFTSFVGEEIAIQLGFYKMILWKHVYSLPFYLVIYLIAHKLAHTTTVKPLN